MLVKIQAHIFIIIMSTTWTKNININIILTCVCVFHVSSCACVWSRLSELANIKIIRARCVATATQYIQYGHAYIDRSDSERSDETV